MTAQEAITQLSEYEPDTELIIGWWDLSHFNDTWNGQVTSDEWSNVVAGSESMDWSHIYETIDYLVDYYHTP